MAGFRPHPRPQPVSIDSHEPGRLDSWKEIAGHLGRGIRSVQRWERSEGLPVHRLSHSKRDSVYAYKDELDAWWKERSGRLAAEPAEEEPAPPARKPVAFRRWWPVAAAVLVVATALTWWLLRRTPVPFSSGDWILVADFENQTGRPVFDQSLATAFTVDLQQSAHANLMPRARAAAALRRMGRSPDAPINEATGREICLRENAKALVVCTIGRAGSQYVLSAQLVNPQTGVTMRSYRETAAGESQILDRLDRIADRLRRDLGESLAAIRKEDHPLPQATTPSLEALQLYAEGRRLWSKGQHSQAMEMYRAALKDDPEFPLLHAAMGSAFASHVLSDPVQAKAHYEQALRGAARITGRERLFIQANYADDFGRLDQAANLYAAYLGLYPDDYTVRFNLGGLLMRRALPEEAAEQFRRVVRAWPGYASAWVNLATCRTLAGRPEEALDSYAKAFELEPGWATSGNLNHEYGFTLVGAGRIGEARRTFEQARAKPGMESTALRSLALLDMYEGHYREAASRLRQALLSDAQDRQALRAARNHLYLAVVEQARGDRAGALREAEASEREMRSAVQTALSARLAAFYARNGEVARAERVLSGIQRQPDTAQAAQPGWLRLAEGEIALARGNRQRAIESLELAQEGSPAVFALRALAEALNRAGETGRAIACYERLLSRRVQSLGWEAQQVWLEAHLPLTELYLARGDGAAAARVRQEMETIWKGADADLPAARRLAALAVKQGRERLTTARD